MKGFIVTMVCVGLLLGMFVSVSQAGFINGFLKDEKSRDYIEYAMVNLHEKQYKDDGTYSWKWVDMQFTTNQGFFSFGYLEGEYILSYGRHDYVWEWYKNVYDSSDAKVIEVEENSTTFLLEELTLIPIGLDVQPIDPQTIPSSGGKAIFSVTLINRTDSPYSGRVTSFIQNISFFGAVNTQTGPRLRYKVWVQSNQEKKLVISIPAEAPDGYYSVVITAVNRDDRWNPYDSIQLGFYKGQQ